MVYVSCVNDGAVMAAWKTHQGLAGSDMIEMVADTQAALTQALDIVLTTNPGPSRVLGAHTLRSKRSAIFVDNGIIKEFEIAEAEDDPAGDARPEKSCIEAMLPLVEKHAKPDVKAQQPAEDITAEVCHLVRSAIRDHQRAD